MTYSKHGKLCSGQGESSLEPSNEGSKNDLVLESLFGALWKPPWKALWRILGSKGTPKGVQKEIQNETPIFVTIFGQGSAA